MAAHSTSFAVLDTGLTKWCPVACWQLSWCAYYGVQLLWCALNLWPMSWWIVDSSESSDKVRACIYAFTYVQPVCHVLQGLTPSAATAITQAANQGANKDALSKALDLVRHVPPHFPAHC